MHCFLFENSCIFWPRQRHCEQLLAREQQAVTAQAELRFRELQWQSRDQPYTNKELIALIGEWTEAAVDQRVRDIARVLAAGVEGRHKARLV